MTSTDSVTAHLAVFSDIENTKENAELPPTKLGGKGSTNERAVLKPVNQNTNRIQPFRAAKQNTTKEGFFSKQPNSISCKPSGSDLGFQIFSEDDSKEVSTIEEENFLKTSLPSKNAIHPALASLPVGRVPLRTLHESSASSENVQDSPMLLDVSEEERLNIFDIDTEEGVSGFSEYALEIFKHLREAELLRRPKRNYMRKQQDITPNMRSILVDWLVEVGEEYRLHNETVHLAVNYIDRFLSQMAVQRGKLQLVGTAAMFLAAKFEEIYPPDVGEFVYITDDTYTKKQVLRMEHLILKVLKFDVAVPTSNQYLKRFLKAAKADNKTEFLSQYLSELALLDVDCVQYLPSKIAASAVCLAKYTIEGNIWDETMEFYMKYSLEELKPCIKDLHSLFELAPSDSQQAIREKYKEVKYDDVASLAAPDSLPFEKVPDSEVIP